MKTYTHEQMFIAVLFGWCLSWAYFKLINRWWRK
jgi:hypothetical protein